MDDLISRASGEAHDAIGALWSVAGSLPWIMKFSRARQDPQPLKAIGGGCALSDENSTDTGSGSASEEDAGSSSGSDEEAGYSARTGEPPHAGCLRGSVAPQPHGSPFAADPPHIAAGGQGRGNAAAGVLQHVGARSAPLVTLNCPWALVRLADHVEAINLGELCDRQPRLFEELARTGPLLECDLWRCRPAASVADVAALKGVLLRLFGVGAHGGYDQALSSVAWSLHDVAVEHVVAVGVDPTAAERLVPPLVFALLDDYLCRAGAFYGASRDALLHAETARAFGDGCTGAEIEPLLVSFIAQWFLCLMTTAGRAPASHALLLWEHLWRHGCSQREKGAGGTAGFLRRALRRALRAPVECDLGPWLGGCQRRWNLAAISGACDGDLAVAPVAAYLEALKTSMREDSFLNALLEKPIRRPAAWWIRAAAFEAG